MCMDVSSPTQFRWLKRGTDYTPVWEAMREFTAARQSDTPDEIWLTEHTPVYTQGQAGKPEHILQANAIPIVQTDRGGQVTYHGPGQLMVYCLLDLRRLGMYVKEYVALLEDSVLAVLHRIGVPQACKKPGAPGVYVPLATGPELAKISALGIKIRNGCSYHGLALNVDMDLQPFTAINPCGYQGMPTTDLRRLGVVMSLEQVAQLLCVEIQQALANKVRRSDAVLAV